MNSEVEGLTQDILRLMSKDTPLNYYRMSVFEEESFVLKMKELEDQGRLSFKLYDVIKSDLPQFLQPYHFVDAEVKTASGATFVSSERSTKGSGVDGSFLSASCHALGEALERHLGFLGGTKDSRNSPTSVLSWAKQGWFELDSDPFGSDASVNPFWRPDGQACHPNLEEAFRNALGEVIERNKLACAVGSDYWYDITESLLAREAHGRASEDYWKSLGYMLKVFVGLSPYGGFVSVATAVGKEFSTKGAPSRKRYGASFRGSAGDFCLDYGPMQAISELNRSAHFGPHLALSSDAETKEAQSKISSESYYYGYLERLLEVDWLYKLASSNSTVKSLEELRAAHVFSPKIILERLAARYGDVYVIPFASMSSSGIFGLKIAVPGLDVSGVSRVRI